MTIRSNGGGIIKSGIIKNVVWPIPAIILISYYSYKNNLCFSLKEMFTNHVNWLKIFPIFAEFTVYALAIGYITQGGSAISPDFKYQRIIVAMSAGLAEEMVFRGWLLNAMVSGASKKKRWLMIILNAAMFLTIHFPKWISEGNLADNFVNLGFLCIIIPGIVFSQTFIKTKNILVPIALHTYWDLLIFLFI